MSSSTSSSGGSGGVLRLDGSSGSGGDADADDETVASGDSETAEGKEKAAAPNAGYIVYDELPKDEWKREIGDEAVWTLSSAKPGNGIEQLRDGNTETFWQYVYMKTFDPISA